MSKSNVTDRSMRHKYASHRTHCYVTTVTRAFMMKNTSTHQLIITRHLLIRAHLTFTTCSLSLTLSLFVTFVSQLLPLISCSTLLRSLQFCSVRTSGYIYSLIQVKNFILFTVPPVTCLTFSSICLEARANSFV